MDNIIKKHREMVARRVSQGFSDIPQDTISKAEEYDDIEKARQVRQDGDIHPNGKWVWRSSAAGGKGDWRVIKKQDGSSEAPASNKTSEKKEGDKPAKASKSSDISSESLMKTLENMSAEDLTKLQDIIASTIAKKTKGADVTKESSEKMQGAIKTVLGQGIKATSKKKTIDKTIFSVGLFENKYGIVNNMKKVKYQSLGILTNIDDDDIKRLKKKYPDISYDGSTQSASKIVQTIIRQSEKIEDVAKNLNESGIMIWDFELVSDNEYRALLRSTRKLADGSYKHILLTKR